MSTTTRTPTPYRQVDSGSTSTCARPWPISATASCRSWSSEPHRAAVGGIRLEPANPRAGHDACILRPHYLPARPAPGPSRWPVPVAPPVAARPPKSSSVIRVPSPDAPALTHQPLPESPRSDLLNVDLMTNHRRAFEALALAGLCAFWSSPEVGGQPDLGSIRDRNEQPRGQISVDAILRSSAGDRASRTAECKHQ